MRVFISMLLAIAAGVVGAILSDYVIKTHQNTITIQTQLIKQEKINKEMIDAINANTEITARALNALPKEKVYQ